MSVFFRSKYGKVQLYSLTTGNIQPLLSLTNLKQVDIPILSKDVIDKITNNEKEANKLLIKSIKKIEEARSIFYDSLGFDIKNIKSDFSFNIKYNDLKEKDIWIPKHYSLLYENINKKLKESLKIEKLGSIVGESFHGIEVGSSNYNIYLDKEKMTNHLLEHRILLIIQLICTLIFMYQKIYIIVLINNFTLKI